MKEVKPSKKPLLFYYGIVLLCVVLFNAFIAPMLMDDPVKEVDYGTFMRMVDNKEVDKVQVNTNEITFMDKEGKVYYTSAMEDPDLTQRLYESGAAFDRVIEKTMSPLVSYLITGVLPIILFVALGQYLYKTPYEPGRRQGFAHVRRNGQEQRQDIHTVHRGHTL